MNALLSGSRCRFPLHWDRWRVSPNQQCNGSLLSHGQPNSVRELGRLEQHLIQTSHKLLQGLQPSASWIIQQSVVHNLAQPPSVYVSRGHFPQPTLRAWKTRPQFTLFPALCLASASSLWLSGPQGTSNGQARWISTTVHGTLPPALQQSKHSPLISSGNFSLDARSSPTSFAICQSHEPFSLFLQVADIKKYF